MRPPMVRYFASQTPQLRQKLTIASGAAPLSAISSRARRNKNQLRRLRGAILVKLVQIELPGGNTSCVVRLAHGGDADGVAPTEPRKDPRTVETDAGVLSAL